MTVSICQMRRLALIAHVLLHWPWADVPGLGNMSRDRIICWIEETR